jgi:hypothetical protein
VEERRLARQREKDEKKSMPPPSIKRPTQKQIELQQKTDEKRAEAARKKEL